MLLSKISNKLLQPLKNIGKQMSMTPAQRLQSETVKQWFKDNGDKTHRLNYPLRSDSIVLDLGGYQGDWSNEIFKKYQSTIFIFEPYLPFYKNIQNRFAGNDKIKVFDFGLAGSTRKEGFSVSANASSMVGKGNHTDEIQLVNVQEFLSQHQLNSIALMKINIEGGEYELMESILQNSLASSFENIQIQFHDFFPDAKNRMRAIQDELTKTHELTYQYEFVWENWRLKK